MSHYWTHRTARFEFVDYVAKGGDRIEVNFVTQWRLGVKEFRAWYYGFNTVAEYHGNYEHNVMEVANGTFPDNLNQISTEGDEYKYSLIISEHRGLNGSVDALAVGQMMEIEVSQFLAAAPEGRNNYYGTTYLYSVGKGGMVPWYTKGDFNDKSSDRENSFELPKSAWLGGETTLPYQYSNEPDNHFMQMATNLSSVNGQAFVIGRRLHHTSFVDGHHDEGEDNGIFEQMVGKTSGHYVNQSCASCHQRNGRAAPAELGQTLDKLVFKVGDENGHPDPDIGRVLQPNNQGEGLSEGTVILTSWTEEDGLRSPTYRFSGKVPQSFSARIAGPIVGIGLLEAIPESSILALEDINDANNDGIKGQAQRVIDPATGELRLGRLGWKAGTTSVNHQVAAAFNADMGVMTSIFPDPDCGLQQSACGSSGSVVTDDDLDHLVKYISLLGVPAQRGLNTATVQQGQQIFNDINCSACHIPTMQTSPYHPLAELRDQIIHPYTDLLLHDMGEGLADNLGEGQASGAQWRTTPLWGIGLSACVTGGMINPTGVQGKEVCHPNPSFLHDGRARSIEEAILWHGGEGLASKEAYSILSNDEKSAVLEFLNSL